MASLKREEVPWHAAYPPPENDNPDSISAEHCLQLLKSVQGEAKDFVLVDLRRNDFEGGTIKGAINLPAQSLYPTLPTLYSLFESAGIIKVIWFCGSSKGRGTRAAGWFADYLKDQGNAKMQSLILLDGIKGWARGGSEYTDLMVEYEPKIWQ